MSLPVIWHPAYEVDIGPHVFVTRKYRLAKERLVEEGTIRESDISRPEPARDEDVALVHDAEYLRKIRTDSFTWRERRELEVPFSEELREAMWLCTGGTIEAARLALDGARSTGRGLALHLGGGFHHAFPDHGEGFCLVNDVAVAARRLRAEGTVGRILIVDLDLHHGNGTAAIFAAEPEVFTFSMHQERNYPAVKPPSDLDLGLADGTGDEAYLGLLAEHLPRIVAGHEPEIAFYLAGADPYRQDQLGRLALSMDGLRRRDGLVFDTLVGARVPVVTLLAGGYAWSLDDTVEIHCNTARAARAAAQGSATA